MNNELKKCDTCESFKPRTIGMKTLDGITQICPDCVQAIAESENYHTLDFPTREEFYNLAKDFSQSVESKEIIISDELQQIAEISELTCPKNQTIDYWNGFFAGMNAGSGAIASNAKFQSEKGEVDFEVLDGLQAFLRWSVLLTWNNIEKKENSVFDTEETETDELK